jgi:ATP-dependent Lhr-like helicase
VARTPDSALGLFHPAVKAWFQAAFGEPTAPQADGWPALARGESTLLLSPTGSGKTLAAFLWCIDRVMFAPVPPRNERCRILYVSPLKALAVDIERNLRSPIVGITNTAGMRGESCVIPSVAVRTGDTPSVDRSRFVREPADILVTTPESLYLLLTSRARDVLRSVATVIIDEIHALVPTKRGSHLALSLERLEAICHCPLQRIGLSATVRPVDEVARFLGGARAGSRRVSSRQRPAKPQRDLHDEFGVSRTVDYRPVTIVDARQPKRLRLKVEVPVEDLARLARNTLAPAGGAANGVSTVSIWSSIHARLVDLIRQHQTTLLFVNSRRLAERLAAALNELAGSTIVRSHHGSLAREQRVEIEDALKAGRIPALVATSSLELGIDMGAIDLVIQIEAPPSITSGIQRIGRGSHRVNAVSEGVIFPKFRGDLVACAAVTKAMHEGRVEATRYPRNPLDVLAQQIVAMVGVDTWRVNDLLSTVRCAAPFASLSRQMFEGVLDMLSGRYPSDDFAELRPRITWDRIAGVVSARQGAKRVAIANGGTIPDRGLYGVFLTGAPRGTARVGELDEEMVFESRVGETFLLGSSSWRIEDITHDRVFVSPAPGEPGKMPFWHGDRPGRPLELGLAIGRLIRELGGMPRGVALARLVAEHDLDRTAAETLLQYLADQKRAAQAVPDDHTIVIERSRDELGDWRICLLAPLGSQVLAPWAMAAEAHIRSQRDLDVDTMWSDDGFVVRFPDTDAPPDTGLLLPPPEEAERLLIEQLGGTALFAARFREVAARALLLPRHRAGVRTPLWRQRKRAGDLLAVAARFGSFPAVLETYRECLRDTFDVPALLDTLAGVASRAMRVVAVDTESPSPFAASLLFGYTANFLYDGDAPLAERRAHALLVDHAQLRDLLGNVELRELLDPSVLDDVEQQLQHVDPAYRVKTADAVHDLLLRIGDLSPGEIRERAAPEAGVAAVRKLAAERRILLVRVAGETRFIAVEDAGRYRDALGVPLPSGLPDSLLEPVPGAVRDLVLRFARTHAPFTADAVARRYGMAGPAVEGALAELVSIGRVVQGEFRPGWKGREFCEADVLRRIRQRSLAQLRRQVEPVACSTLGRFAASWHGLAVRRKGLDALLDAVEQLQGVPLIASLLEREILPARIEGFVPGDLDVLAAAGEIVWIGIEPMGERDGRLALFLADHLPRLVPPAVPATDLSDRPRLIVEHLRKAGASFFAAIHTACGGGYPGETVEALWDLAWRGIVTNDTWQALRAFVQPPPRHQRNRRAPAFRSRRMTPPAAEGRWSLVSAHAAGGPSLTERTVALAWQLLNRHGILTRETMAVENVPGGFSAVYAVLKTLEDSGRVRRGYFVTGLGAAQFALPAAVDLLRSLRLEPATPQTVYLAAADPANPYGAILRWPASGEERDDVGPDPNRRGPVRQAGAGVILVNGALAAYLGRADRRILTFLPTEEPERGRVAAEIARMLHLLATGGSDRLGMLIATIDGMAAASHPLAPYLADAGFVRRPTGFQASPPRDTQHARG